MYTLTTNEGLNKVERTNSSQSQIGDIMIITEEGRYLGHVILRIYEELVSLTIPDWTWNANRISFKVRFLNPEESVILTVKP